MGLLDGKVAVVTGAGQGIGRAIAMGLAADGAAVVVNDIGVSLTGERENANIADDVVQAITDRGGQAAANSNSIADWDGAQGLIQTAIDRFGRVDIVVNNAGILRDAIFHKLEPDQWQAVINVHLNGSYYVARAAAPHMRSQNGGSMIFMTSTAGLIGNFGQANYMAAKMGMVGLARSIAMDMQRFNVRANCIAPFAWSRMISSMPVESEADKARVEKLQRMTPEKIVPLVSFLGSDRADAVSGQIFTVRNNEIFLMSQPRPIRSIHRSDGWTAETLADILPDAMSANFSPLERSTNVFSWDPI